MRCESYISTNFFSIWGFVTSVITQLKFIHTPVCPEDYSLSWMGDNITWLVHITRCNNDTHSAIQGCNFHTTCPRVCPEDGIMYPVNCYSSWTFQAPANHIWWFKMKEHYFQHSSWYLIYLSLAEQSFFFFFGGGEGFFISSLCWGQLCSPHSLLPIGYWGLFFTWEKSSVHETKQSLYLVLEVKKISIAIPSHKVQCV